MGTHARSSPARARSRWRSWRPGRKTRPASPTRAGRQQSSRALRRWEAALRVIPAQRFPGPAGQHAPRYGHVYFESPATERAVAEVARQTQLPSESVLLAAFGVSMARCLGSHPAVVRVVVSNRFRSGLADSVSPLSQTGLCVLDLAGITFGEAVRRAWRGSLSAAKNAYYDPLELAAVIERVSAERGEEVDVSCFVNDRRMFPRDDETSAPVGAGAPPESTLTLDYMDTPCDRMFFSINGRDMPARYMISFDSCHVAPADAQACMRTIEEITVMAARNPAMDTGIRARPEMSVT